jgi:hypothetical protein
VILRPGPLAGVRVLAGGLVGARMAELGADVNAAGREADVLVWDGAATFASASGVDAVRAVLDGAWEAIRAALADDLLIVLLAPPPGDAHAVAASPAEIAELAAFLASPAGAYFSGCRFDLGRVSPLSA